MEHFIESAGLGALWALWIFGRWAKTAKSVVQLTVYYRLLGPALVITVSRLLAARWDESGWFGRGFCAVLLALGALVSLSPAGCARSYLERHEGGPNGLLRRNRCS